MEKLKKIDIHAHCNIYGDIAPKYIYNQTTIITPEKLLEFYDKLNIEKGVFITTGSFSKAATEEASAPGKQQIDLIDGEEFITKLAEFGIGVHEIKDYEIDEEYFAKI